ncbi:alpha/beta hydrolase [Sphingomonas sp. PAMC 26621]|uniref:alpha/beta hydrolase n=1 Tax=Sphingomonas sp. PAMC 26621 TaxID=1112213 RepID=UPI0002892329|nr:alpha/beta hydrolase [Sphingomonas sp. PAMC 26621]
MDAFANGLATPPHAIVVSVKNDRPRQTALEQIDLDLSKFHNGQWALQLDAALSKRAAPVVILAHGLACLAVSWWAQLSPRSYLKAVRGAVFDSPLSVDLAHLAAAATFRTGPRYTLPFPSVVVSDPTAQIDQVLALADTWGSCFVPADAIDLANPSNRLARSSDTEEMLLAHVALLQRGAEDARVAAPHSVWRADEGVRR